MTARSEYLLFDIVNVQFWTAAPLCARAHKNVRG